MADYPNKRKAMGIFEDLGGLNDDTIIKFSGIWISNMRVQFLKIPRMILSNPPVQIPFLSMITLKQNVRQLCPDPL
jgi:hypothetical protein